MRVSSLSLVCFAASRSPFSASCSPDSWSTLAIRSFFTTFRAFLWQGRKTGRGLATENGLRQPVTGRDPGAYLVSRSWEFSSSRFPTSLPIPESKGPSVTCFMSWGGYRPATPKGWTGSPHPTLPPVRSLEGRAGLGLTLHTFRASPHWVPVPQTPRKFRGRFFLSQIPAQVGTHMAPGPMAGTISWAITGVVITGVVLPSPQPKALEQGASLSVSVLPWSPSHRPVAKSSSRGSWAYVRLPRAGGGC